MERYRIGELAEKAEVTKRTIHYYVNRGLLPSPEGAGVGTYYTDDHLYRILLIKKYQESYLPLDEIKKLIGDLNFEEIKTRLEDNIVREEESLYEASSKTMEVGNSYKRVSLGFGVEIHFPEGDEKARELAIKLLEFSSKINRGA